MTYQNKTVWITGASSGIGEALAYEFAKQGATLLLSARSVDKLEQVKQACLEHTATVAVVPLDLSKYEQLSTVVKPVLEQFPKIDLLINNGGISQRSLAKDTDISVDERLMVVNYLGTVAMTKAILPNMLMHGIGHIATVTSMVGKFGTPMRSSYAASKHALHGFMDSLRAELADTDIAITLICPGFIHTRISYNALTGDGSPQNSLDKAQAGGMSAEIFAKKAINALENKVREVHIGGTKEVAAGYVKRFFPGLFARIISKAAVT